MMRLMKFTAMIVLALLTQTSPGGRADAGASYKRTVENYTVPEVTLVNQDGVKTRLRDVLLSDKPVLVNFIYTTCTTICPVLSANFTNFQRRLGADADKVRLVSISIDPDNDRPRTMKTYLQRYGAKPGWQYLTGARDDIEKTLFALNAYTPNKMSHTPLILMREPSRGQWVRIYGLIGTTDLVREYERMAE